MEKELKDVRIYGIMEEVELQEVLNKIHNHHPFSNEEILDLVRQILHWRSQYHHENKNFKKAIQSRNLYKQKLEGSNRNEV